MVMERHCEKPGMGALRFCEVCCLKTPCMFLNDTYCALPYSIVKGQVFYLLDDKCKLKIADRNELKGF